MSTLLRQELREIVLRLSIRLCSTYSPIVTCWLHLRQFPNSRIHSTVIDHLPCNTHGGGTCRNTKWEIAILEKLLLSHVGDFIGISTIIGHKNLLKTRLQVRKPRSCHLLN